MIITELKELTKILYFEGEYALFRAKDKEGMYHGVINRHGEILWTWRHITMRVKGYPNLFKTITDNEGAGFVYFDVEKLDFVEAPMDCSKHGGVQDLDDVRPGGEPNHFVVTLEDRDKRKKNKVGVIDDKGEWIIPHIYDSMHWRRAYYVAYIKEPHKKRKCGLLDKQGNILVPFEYDFLDPSYTEDLISAKKRGRFLFINSHNEKIKLF